MKPDSKTIIGFIAIIIIAVAIAFLAVNYASKKNDIIDNPIQNKEQPVVSEPSEEMNDLNAINIETPETGFDKIDQAATGL